MLGTIMYQYIYICVTLRGWINSAATNFIACKVAATRNFISANHKNQFTVPKWPMYTSMKVWPTALLSQRPTFGITAQLNCQNSLQLLKCDSVLYGWPATKSPSTH